MSSDEEPIYLGFMSFPLHVQDALNAAAAHQYRMRTLKKAEDGIFNPVYWGLTPNDEHDADPAWQVDHRRAPQMLFGRGYVWPDMTAAVSYMREQDNADVREDRNRRREEPRDGQRVEDRPAGSELL